jgi:outer membrane immunogenic protein
VLVSPVRFWQSLNPMKANRFLFVAMVVCAVALCMGTTANAGTERYSSKEVAPAPVVEPFSWTGFYIGGNLGGTWSNYRFGNFFEDVDVIQQADEFFGPAASGANTSLIDGNSSGEFGFAAFLFPGTGPEGSLFDVGSSDGFTGGGQLGFNYQFGQHFLIGLEGDFNRTATSRSQTFLGTDTTFFGGTTSGGLVPIGEFTVTDVTAIRRAEQDWNASARARLGWVNGHVLLYVTGGAAWTQINVFANDSARTEFFEPTFLGSPDTNAVSQFPIFGTSSLGAISNSNFSKVDDVVLGWTVGGGGEWAITDTVSVGVEYRHSDFGDHTYHFADHGGPIFPGPMKVNLENDQVTVRFNILLSHFFGH